MKNTIQNLRVCGTILILGFLAAIVITLATQHDSTPSQIVMGIIAGVGFALIGVILWVVSYFLKKSYMTKEYLANISLPEKCKVYAESLKKGKRFWYLTPVAEVMKNTIFFENGHFIALPLYPEDLEELGPGKHIPSREDEVRKYFNSGQIQNAELVARVFYELALI